MDRSDAHGPFSSRGVLEKHRDLSGLTNIVRSQHTILYVVVLFVWDKINEQKPVAFKELRVFTVNTSSSCCGSSCLWKKERKNAVFVYSRRTWQETLAIAFRTSTYWNVSCLHLHSGRLLPHLPHSEHRSLLEAKQWGVRRKHRLKDTHRKWSANGTQVRSKKGRKTQETVTSTPSARLLGFHGPRLNSFKIAVAALVGDEALINQLPACETADREVPTAEKSLLNQLRSRCIVQWERVNSASVSDDASLTCGGGT